MESTIIQLKQHDGYETRLFYYETSKDTLRGTILVLHGMAEHHGRYLDFISSLTNEGYDVYTYDHRGHGTDKKLAELGFVSKKKGSYLLTEDARTVCHYIKEHGRTSSLAVFGHSMGSLVLRCIIRNNDDIDCAIVSSTAMPPAMVSRAGVFLSNLVCLFRGANYRSSFLQNTMFGGKAYSSLCTRTTYDWLTRNNTIVGKYIDDPYCGFLCAASFYRDVSKLSLLATDKRCFSETRKTLPMLFLAGDKDPVGGYSSHVLRLHKRYISSGYEKAELILYQDDRHELLNELNAEEVCQDIISYLNTHLH